MVEMKDTFCVEKQTQHMIDSIKNYFTNSGNSIDTKAVIGISGGKDSTVAAALLCRALGPDRVIAVKMPFGNQDMGDADKIIQLLGIKKFYEFDIQPACEALYKQIENSNIQAIRTNVPARIRMTTLYMVAAQEHGRVINTGNASEAYIGYTTKYGDLAGDYAILKDYCVHEIYAIGDYLGLPYKWVHKTPDDGMCGVSDEVRIGFSYETLDNYILHDIFPDAETLYCIKKMFRESEHKRHALNIPCIRKKHFREDGEDCGPWEF